MSHVTRNDDQRTYQNSDSINTQDHRVEAEDGTNSSTISKGRKFKINP